MFTCDICNKNFNSNRSLASHKNHHNPEYHKKSKEGAKFLQSKEATQARKKYYESTKYKNWSKIERKCVVCETRLEYSSLKTYYIDFYLPKQNIGIELDGVQHRNTVEYDQQRDREIFDAIGAKIIRVSYKEYFDKSKKEYIDNLLQKENL